MHSGLSTLLGRPPSPRAAEHTSNDMILTETSLAVLDVLYFTLTLLSQNITNSMIIVEVSIIFNHTPTSEHV